MSLTLFTIYLIFRMHGSEAAGGLCKTSERSIPGKALKGHIFKEFAVRAIVDCQNTCENDPRCASYNYYIPDKVCKLNSQTKETRPDDFVTDELRFYVRRDDDDECLKMPLVCDINANCKNTLGSYLCSCREGFKGDDSDECLNKSHNCSENATCTNTEGSFNCNCKPGYIGNGHNCSG
ncbi:unnamed protein product [Porites evermanni]|uniref:Uncharacterized protein n=1 Tax=Porites evermanni TaxID=104178 RepID=A0ABN8T3X9_9CNID|nr:unnamed protein product [Porites evermanni]